ncbi:hypothetical protein [Chloroflexus sp.]|uniref:hypothetical protein n=1 Tax=Chloroflexus sp. TaxID=1904827 RepID=UPI002ACDC8F1|nr:hypothetical protein [Chloroflexus sp.]
MWLIAYYRPTALFSLKLATATSSGGRTLICPTPFALRMALLDAAIRTLGATAAQRLWPLLRGLRLKVLLPDRLTVINTFTKIVRLKKMGPSDDTGTGLITPFNNTIAYREYVSFGGDIGISVQTEAGDSLPNEVAALFAQITYLGKRGGFLQLLDRPEYIDQEPDEAEGWTLISADQTQFKIGGTLQMLDDCSSKLTFEQANIYSDKRIVLGKDRILRHVVLPYRLVRSSRSFSLYERIRET